jgi:adenine-specific DNA-methyltransferase
MRSKEEIKETGATFTPSGLANYLANLITPFIQVEYPKVLDPACGDGALIKAMHKSLDKKGQRAQYFGFDADQGYLQKANQSFINDGLMASLIHKDFLDSLSIESDENHGKYDAIIANPPYVRTQVLGAEKAQELADQFDLKGRVDLYYPFLIGMTEKLKEGGVLGVLTSNRYLTTKSGECIRQFLSDNFEILHVIDLGDTKLFDAAVLPAIFLGRKKTKKSVTTSMSHFTKIYEELNGKQPEYNAGSVFEAMHSDKSGCFLIEGKKFNLSRGLLLYEQGSKELWQMLTDNEAKWIERIESNSIGKIKDFFKVRVGVKTTADKVFIKKNWDSTGVEKPEDELLYPLISQNNIDRWRLNEKEHLELLYTHYDNYGKKAVIDLEKYPKAAKYLDVHRKQLEGRSYVIKSKRNWFEIWVPQNPASWKQPKLVFPDISVEPRFYFDLSGSIVNGNCYWIFAKDKKEQELLLLIQGVANSSVISKYHDLLFNNKLYSGRRRYFSQYVENYPIPDPNLDASKRIIKLVKELNSKKEDSQKNYEFLNELVEEAFGL